MNYEFKGKLITTSETSGVSMQGKAWRKLDVIILHEEGQYNKHVAVSIMNEELIEKVKALPQNSVVVAKCGINAREYNGKWYNSIDCFKCELEQAQQIGQSMPMQQQAPAQPMQQQTGFTAPATPTPTNPTVFDGDGAGVQGNADTGELPF